MPHTKNKLLRAGTIITIGIIFVFSVSAIYNKFIVHNISISEPTGYYLILPVNEINVGNRYLVCLQDKKHIEIMHKLKLPMVESECPYHSPYILKQVAAVPGDWVVANESGIYINGRYQTNSSPILVFKNINLEPLPFNYHHYLESNEYFMMGITRTSYDSRYFGVVKSQDFHKRAILLMSDQ